MLGRLRTSRFGDHKSGVSETAAPGTRLAKAYLSEAGRTGHPAQTGTRLGCLMVPEQLWHVRRYTSPIVLIVLFTFVYVSTRRRLARGEALFPPNASAVPGFRVGVRRFLQQIDIEFAPRFKLWMLLMIVLAGGVMLIDAIRHHG